MKLFFNQGSVFWPGKSKSDVYFCQPELGTIDNLEKNYIFRIIEGFRIKVTKNQLLRFNYWLMLMYYYLLPQKCWRFFNFSGPKLSFGRRDSAGTKWSAEGAERVPSQPATREPCCRVWYSQLPGENIIFRIIEVDIGFEFSKSKYTNLYFKKFPFWTFLIISLLR